MSGFSVVSGVGATGGGGGGATAGGGVVGGVVDHHFHLPHVPLPTDVPPPPPAGAQCATYTFPEPVAAVGGTARGHSRSASHGGGGVAPTRSALKGARGHQRALSQGQISEVGGAVTAAGSGAPTSAGGAIGGGGARPGHSRVGSKTEFILPPGYKEEEPRDSSRGGSSGKGHSRQASRSESIYTLRRSAPPPLWRRALCALIRRSPKNEQEERYRIVVPNHIVPPKTPRKEHPNGRRPDNRIRTTKYTLLSFLPRNLLEQFHRVANLYFIFIVLLNWFPAINAFGKEIAMIPVMFVLGVTAVKDLFEDRRRHASDKRINNSTCRIYNSEACRYRKVLWKEVRVGDLIHLSNNEVVPADILLLRSSDPSGCCYIDTGHLDGETNLKQRQVARGFVEKQRIFEPSKFRSTIEVEAPTTKIYRFHGAIVHPSGGRVPVGTDNLLLRECLLKNTDYIEGIVVYAGHETKAMLNNGGPRYKRSSLEKQMNQDVIWCVFILIFLCVIGAIGCKLWLAHYKDLAPPFKENDDTTEAFLAFWTFIIILQIMIPLSLYVTLEMCKIIQVYHIHHNVDLYDSAVDKRTECRALNITEELGQIQYIFSDKTGTLTENRMIFRRCAIAGVDYNHPFLENESMGASGATLAQGQGHLSVAVNDQLLSDLRREVGLAAEQTYCLGGGVSAGRLAPTHSGRIQEFLLLLAICNTVVCSQHPHIDLMNASGIIEQPSLFDKREHSGDHTSSSSTSQSLSMNDKYTRLEESRSVTPSPPLNTYLLDNKRKDSSTMNNYATPDSRQRQQQQHVQALSPIDSVECSPTQESAATIPTTTASATVAQGGSKGQRPKLLNIPYFLKKGNNLTDEQKAKLRQQMQSGGGVPGTPSPYDLKPIFEAESPDELALVDAAYNYGCRLLRRTPTSVTVETPDDGRLNYEILNVLPFDSTRKRMSIIVRHPNTKQIILYCKGADSAMLPQMTPVEDDSEQKLIISKTQQHLNQYAREGLRVLLMAKRVLTQHQYDEWYRRHREAELSIENLDRKVRDSYSSIESNLTLLGATGIEDRLQEGVPETLSSLIAAGIVVWVLTGDKPETAINIAYSAKLFSPQMELLKLMARSKEAAETTIHCYLAEIERSMGEGSAPGADNRIRPSTSTNDLYDYSQKRHKTRALAVDGKTLTFILDRRANLTKPFLRLTTYCNSVLCCRATPLQKAYIVKVVKEELKMRTLAIGDGANDVSMIQTADVGIGISGQEGMQAVMAADFALSRFKYLERFLLVHGHWSYDRLSRMVLYFFYKNAAFVFLCFWYQMYCGFSGTVMIDQMYLMLYNLLFTSLPPLAIGVYDQDAPYEVLLERPWLYRRGRTGRVYRPYSFWVTMLDALYQSTCIFFLCQQTYHGTDVDVFEFGTVATTACMFVMLLHASIEMRSWTVIHVASIVLSICAFYLYSLIYNTYCVHCFGLPSTYWTIQIAMSKPIYWLVTFLSCVVALLPRLVYRVAQTMLCPDEVTRALVSHKRAASREPPITGLSITL